jgi:hypothetical protein
MNIIASCQGKNYTIFRTLSVLLQDKQQIDIVGAFVSDSMSFDSQHKDTDNIVLLKEWEVFSKAKNTDLNWNLIKEYEDKITGGYLWDALLADRRIFFGKKCKFQQDYPSRFESDEMWKIMQVALQEIDNFFNTTKPDIVLSFGIANLGDYLFYLFAKSKNIIYLQLKSTKIANRVSFNDDAVSLSRHIQDSMARNNYEPLVTQEATEYITQVRNSGVMYEGAILQNKKINIKRTVISLLAGVRASIRKNLNTTYRNDNHLESYFLLQMYDKLINPLKYNFIQLRLRKYILGYGELESVGDFIFFPLHFEPEVSMQVYGKGYQNQIELIRSIALSIPAGMKVVIKEHPRSKGFRSLNYYKKILQIPGTVFADTSIPTNTIVKKSKLVATISGSTGLEAAIIGKPVITFGAPVYNILPDSMVLYIDDINTLSHSIKQILGNYKYDYEYLLNYISAIIDGSVPIDLYTLFLEKEDRFANNNSDDIQQQYHNLVNYLTDRMTYKQNA